MLPFFFSFKTLLRIFTLPPPLPEKEVSPCPAQSQQLIIFLGGHRHTPSQRGQGPWVREIRISQTKASPQAGLPALSD